jgi:peroxiredoxin family protein
MTAKTLYITLCSGEHEKIHMAAMMASVAAVSGRKVELFVSMNAMYAFGRATDPSERYQGGPFSQLMLEKKAPDTLTLFGQGKMLGDMKAYACSMAMDLLAWTLDDLVEDLFDGELGLTKFLSDAEEGDLIVV